VNTLDWILLAIVLLLAIRCLFRGFVAELLSTASYIVGFVAALLLYKPAGKLIMDKLGLAKGYEIAGFVAVFVLAFILVKILERMLKQSLESAHLAAADKLLGFALGAAEGLIAISLILLVIQVQPLFDAQKLLDGSFFAKMILPIVGPKLSQALGGPPTGMPKVEIPKVELPKVELPKIELPKPIKP